MTEEKRGKIANAHAHLIYARERLDLALRLIEEVREGETDQETLAEFAHAKKEAKLIQTHIDKMITDLELTTGDA